MQTTEFTVNNVKTTNDTKVVQTTTIKGANADSKFGTDITGQAAAGICVVTGEGIDDSDPKNPTGTNKYTCNTADITYTSATKATGNFYFYGTDTLPWGSTTNKTEYCAKAFSWDGTTVTFEDITP